MICRARILRRIKVRGEAPVAARREAAGCVVRLRRVPGATFRVPAKFGGLGRELFANESFSLSFVFEFDKSRLNKANKRGVNVSHMQLSQEFCLNAFCETACH